MIEDLLDIFAFCEFLYDLSFQTLKKLGDRWTTDLDTSRPRIVTTPAGKFDDGSRRCPPSGSRRLGVPLDLPAMNPPASYAGAILTLCR
jgi:hypothetical protein